MSIISPIANFRSNIYFVIGVCFNVDIDCFMIIRNLNAEVDNIESGVNTNLPAYPYDFNDQEAILSNREFFIAEYNSLRGEIQQRLSTQTTITQIAITAWGLILSYALEKVDHNSYNNAFLVLLYPLLAYFISFAWAFNNTRICQIANYLKKREKQLSIKFGFIGWENYVHDVDTKNIDTKNKRSKKFIFKLVRALFDNMVGTNKVKPGITVLAGTQLVALAVAIALIGLHLFKNSPNFKVDVVKLAIAVFAVAFDGIVIYLTLLTLSKSGHWQITALEDVII